MELRFLDADHLDEQRDDVIPLGRFLGVPVVALRDSWFLLLAP